VSPELEAVLLKGMAFKKEDRYPSARAFASALKRFAETTPTSILPVYTPKQDTLDDSSPVAATAPTRSAPSRTSAETVVSGIPQGTMEPVVTPVPADLPPKSSRRASAIAFALLVLGAAGVGTLMSTQDDDQSADSSAASSAEPPDAPPPELAPLEAPIADTITLSFAVAPTDASIFVDGELIAGNSVELPMGTAPLMVEVKKDGFESQSRRVAVTSNDTLAFALVAVEPPPIAVVESAKTPQDHSSKKSRKNKNRKTEKKKTDRRFVGESPYDAP
jgi:hypothetical protein